MRRIRHGSRHVTWAIALMLALAAGTPAAAIGKRHRQGGGHRHQTPSASAAPARGLPVSAMNGFWASRLPLPQLDRQLTPMAADGVKVVRIDAPWGLIEPQPPGPAGHSWQFGQSDSWAAALAAHHLTWEPLLDYSTGWAKACSGFCPPSDYSTYAAFAQAVAARYGEHGTFWAEHPGLPYYPARIFEVWNEENTSAFWSTGPNAGQYARLYMSARSAIKAVDRSASVIVGGLDGPSIAFNPQQDEPAQFVQQMLAAQPRLRGRIDGFGLHPYAPTAQDDVEWVIHFRHVLDSIGEGPAPIDITEFGWPAGIGPARETWRAWEMLTFGLYLAHSNCGIRLLAPYDWVNPLGFEGSADFGFVDRIGTSLRRAGRTWFYALKLAVSKPEQLTCSGGGPGRHGRAVGGGLPGFGAAPAPGIFNLFSLRSLAAGGGQSLGGSRQSCWSLRRPWRAWSAIARTPVAAWVPTVTVKRPCGTRVGVTY